MTDSGFHSLRSVPTAFAVIVAASFMGGCVVQPAEQAPKPPGPFVEVARTYRENFASFPTTAALVQETASGCLYSVAEGKGAAAVILPDGRHAGCRLTGNPSPDSVGIANGDEPKTLRAKDTSQ